MFNKTSKFTSLDDVCVLYVSDSASDRISAVCCVRASERSACQREIQLIGCRALGRAQANKL